MKTKDRLNLSCGEPELCYFRKSGEKGWTKLVSSAGRSEDQRSIEPVVWGTRVGLLQEEWRERNSWIDCMRSQSCSTSKCPPSDRPFQGNSFQDCKIKWRRADKSSRVQPWGRGFFSWFELEEDPSFFLTPHLTLKKKRRQKEKKRGWLLDHRLDLLVRRDRLCIKANK